VWLNLLIQVKSISNSLEQVSLSTETNPAKTPQQKNVPQNPASSVTNTASVAGGKQQKHAEQVIYKWW
jgi:hypothetical protein